MKWLWLLVAMALAQVAEAQTWAETLLAERAIKDRELKSKKHSPLQKADRKRWHGAQYFEPDSAFVVMATLTTNPIPDTVEMPTSSGKPKVFIAYGTLSFALGGTAQQLTGFVRHWPDGPPQGYEPSLFVPFTDHSTGQTTYGGGRYLDLPLENAAQVTIDFNRCYNPYCAYGGGFSCPVPPPENRLSTLVNAGEQYVEH